MKELEWEVFMDEEGDSFIEDFNYLWDVTVPAFRKRIRSYLGLLDELTIPMGHRGSAKNVPVQTIIAKATDQAIRRRQVTADELAKTFKKGQVICVWNGGEPQHIKYEPFIQYNDGYFETGDDEYNVTFWGNARKLNKQELGQ